MDGQGLRTLLDTGAGASLVTAPGMMRLGLTAAGLAGDPQGATHGIGPFPVRMYRHRFASLSVGGEAVRDPSLWVAEIRVLPVVDLILGTHPAGIAPGMAVLCDCPGVRGGAGVIAGHGLLWSVPDCSPTGGGESLTAFEANDHRPKPRSGWD